MVIIKQKYNYTYKYLPFENDNCLKPITDGTLLFSCPLKFNDPFDCHPIYDIDSLSDLTRKRSKFFKEAARIQKTRSGFTSSKKEMAQRLIENVESGSFRRDFLSGIGVVSLSKNGLSPLMWSHYANSHEGFVLEFKTPEYGLVYQTLRNFDLLVSLPVNYQEDRPVVEIGFENEDELIEKQLLTKSSDWVYEDEVRVIDHVRKPGIYHYSRDEVLCSVIAGSRIPELQLEKLSKAVNDARIKIPRLQLFQAELSKEKFKVTVPNHPRLGLGQ